MKKLICLLLALVMVMALAACGGETNEPQDENKKAYEDAVAAYNAGDFGNAVQMLTALGDYQDASQLLATIKAEKTGVTVATTTSEGVTTRSVEYVFRDGNPIKETVTHADGTITKNYYKYNEDGLCSSETINDLEGGKIVINHFYENGSKIRTVRTNADKSKDTYRFTCDESGKIISHMLTYFDGTVEEAIYTYDDTTGLLASIATADSFTTFAYNQYGDLTNEFLTVNGQDVHKVAYTYTYRYFVD